MRHLFQSRLFCVVAVGLCSIGQWGCNRILTAEPARIDYGHVFIGDQVTRSVVWSRPGPDEPGLKSVKLTDSDQGYQIVKHESGTSSSPQARVRFSPEQYRTYQATLVPILTSGEEAQPVTLIGQGVYVKQEDRLRLEAAGLSRSQPLDVGQVRVGGKTTHELTLTNLGSSPLTLHPDWRKADVGFGIKDQSRTIRIPYGESKTIDLTFKPKHEGIHTDRLGLISENDQIAGVVLIGVGKRR